MKELSSISWQVTEPEYRADPALSQSILSNYERGGFKSIKTLFEHETSDAMTFGSMVDAMLTGGQQEFDSRFVVGEFPKLEPTVEGVILKLKETCGETYHNLYDIPEHTLLSVIEECGFRSKWNNATKLEKILTKDTAEYYKLLCVSNKEIVGKDAYTKAMDCVQCLKHDEATYHYFRDNDDKSSIKRYYQLKFKSVIDGVEYRCMLDLILVDYEHKVIIPCDLKTSSNDEYNFHESLKKWRYDIQARLYWRILRENLDRDEYFRDFELRDFRFIVINPVNKTPLVWHLPESKDTGGEIMLGNRVYRAPWDIGTELRHYLDTDARVPDGIHRVGINNISDWIK